MLNQYNRLALTEHFQNVHETFIVDDVMLSRCESLITWALFVNDHMNNVCEQLKNFYLELMIS